MSASERVTSILWTQALAAFVTFSSGAPAVCMTETKKPGLEFLIGRRNYEPWALLFDRQCVYDAGGGPVWYVRPDEYRTLGEVAPHLRSWAVRLDPDSDWLEEREWRIPRPAPEPEYVMVSQLRLIGLIVGDPHWNALQHFPTGTGNGLPPGYYIPELLRGISRFWWNPAEQRLDLLAPLL